jgi:diacylglycerol O-acyltransferase
MAHRRVVNLYVSNIPGPRIPVYLVGARMLEIFPVAPIALGGALSVALFSYAGGICFGFNSDWDKFPDLHDMAQAIDLEFETLRKAAAGGPADPPA